MTPNDRVIVAFPDPSAVSEVIAVRGRSDFRVFAHALDGDAFRYPREFADDEALRVEVLVYASSLEALDLREGELLPPLETELARALPPAKSIFALDVELVAASEWTQSSSMSRELAAFRTGMSLDRCIERGGCLPENGGPECVEPCPTSPPMIAPSAPAVTSTRATPIFEPCPPGWGPREEDGIIMCEPFPNERPRVCPRDHVIFPGESACHPIGDPCPAGDFAAEVRKFPNVTYVRDDSELNFAMTSSTSGPIIALAKGTYIMRPVTFGRPITLWGACAAQTRITPSTTAGQSLIFALAPIELRGLSLSGVRVGIIAREAGVLLDGVSIDSDANAIRVQSGSTATVTDSIFRGTGLAMVVGGAANVQRAYVEDVHVDVSSGARLEISDSFFVETSSRTPTQYRIRATNDAEVVMNRVVVDSVRGIHGVGGKLDITESVLRSASVLCDPCEGSIRRTRIVRVAGSAIEVRNESVMHLEDVVVRDTKDKAEGEAGIGLEVASGSIVEGARVVLANSQTCGARVSQVDTALDLDGFLFRDNSRTSTGAGVFAFGGASVSLAHGEVVRSIGTGVDVLCSPNAATTVELREVRIADTGDGGTTAESHGFRAYCNQQSGMPSSIRLEKTAITGSRFGAAVLNGAVALLTDVELSDTLPNSENGCGGRALKIDGRASVQGSQIRMTRNVDTALLVRGADASFDAESIEISDTATASDMIAPDDRPKCVVGRSGAVVELAGRITLRDFRLTANGTGAGIAASSELDLTNGIVESHDVGVRMPDSNDYDRSRLSAGVVYRQNRRIFSP